MSIKEAKELLSKGYETEQCGRHTVGVACPCCTRFMILIKKVLEALDDCQPKPEQQDGTMSVETLQKIDDACGDKLKHIGPELKLPIMEIKMEQAYKEVTHAMCHLGRLAGECHNEKRFALFYALMEVQQMLLKAERELKPPGNTDNS